MCTCVHFVLFANVEGEGLMSDIAANHQGATQMFWLHFQGAIVIFSGDDLHYQDHYLR